MIARDHKKKYSVVRFVGPTSILCLLYSWDVIAYVGIFLEFSPLNQNIYQMHKPKLPNIWMVLLPTISFLSLILACLVTKSHLRLVFPMPPSPDFTPNIVPVFKSPHEAAQQSFQLSKTNIHHAICLIGSGRADNAIWVTKSLRDVVNQPISTQTIQNGLKNVGCG